MTHTILKIIFAGILVFAILKCIKIINER